VGKVNSRIPDYHISSKKSSHKELCVRSCFSHVKGIKPIADNQQENLVKLERIG
jgi:hypothetical protein